MPLIFEGTCSLHHYLHTRKGNVLNERLKKVCDIITESHTRIQKDFADINPMVGVNQHMRKMDVPVDVITIDSLKSGKRIIVILHDHHPDIVRFQFTFKEKDPDENFDQLPTDELTANKVYTWIADYFQ